MYRVASVHISNGPELMCYSPPELAIHVQDNCVVQDGRLLEFGRVLSLTDREGDYTGRGHMPHVLRQATLQDQSKARENDILAKVAGERCGSRMHEMSAGTRVVRVRYSFDRTVLRILFTADERVDFRELIRQLHEDLGVHVEMKQIGVRDEAGIIGGMGPCGRCLCCCSWLKRFESINVKMAKTQRLSLNPGAISGMCGRLKCCLSYEFEQYRQLGRGLPRDGTEVRCPDGPGRVVGIDTLARRVRVRLGDERVHDYDADELRRL